MGNETKEVPESKRESDKEFKEFLEFVGTIVGQNNPPPEELMERDGRPTLSPDGTS